MSTPTTSMQPPAPPISSTPSRPSKQITGKREGSAPVSLSSAFAFSTPPSVKGKEKKAARPIGSLTPFGNLGGSSTSNGPLGGSPFGQGAGGAKRLPPAPLFSSSNGSSTSINIKREPKVSLRDGTPLRAASETASSIDLPPPGQAVRPSPSESPSLVPPTPSRLNAIRQEEATTPVRKAPKKLSALSSFSTSPFLLRATDASSSPITNGVANTTDNGKRRKLGEIGYAIPAMPDDSPRHPRTVEGKTVGLGAVNDSVRLEEIDMDEWKAQTGKEEVEKEVGVGISPRKGKVKWNGRGDPPLSMRLASLASAESAALTLFYTALYHTLNPSARTPAKRPRPPLHAPQQTETNPQEETQPQAISALSHIRTAPIRLVLVRPGSARAHNSHMWVAAVLRWPRIARPDPLQQNQRHGQDENEESPSTILVNLALPSNSTRATGVDPRKVEERWRAEGSGPSVAGQGASQDHGLGWVDDGRELVSTWEVGVWSGWNMMDLPLDPGDGESERSAKRKEVRKVLFATRYLVAEGKLKVVER